MNRDQLARAMRAALDELVESRELRTASPAAVVLRPPGPGGSGDWASAVALELAGPSRMPARELAELLAARLRHTEGVTAVEVTAEGFLNVSVAGSRADGVVAAVLAAGPGYGMPDGAEPLPLGPPPSWVAAADQPRTMTNPLFVVQLAHARLAALTGSAGVASGGHHDAGLVLLLEELPALVRRAVRARDPEVLGRHLEAVAGRALRWLEDADGRVDADLVAAAGLVLAAGLRLLEVSAPRRI